MKDLASDFEVTNRKTFAQFIQLLIITIGT